MKHYYIDNSGAGGYDPATQNMRRFNHVCWECRSTKRGGISTQTCSNCGNPMVRIGERYRLPKKTNKKAWTIARNKFNKNP